MPIKETITHLPPSEAFWLPKVVEEVPTDWDAGASIGMKHPEAAFWVTNVDDKDTSIYPKTTAPTFKSGGGVSLTKFRCDIPCDKLKKDYNNRDVSKKEYDDIHNQLAVLMDTAREKRNAKAVLEVGERQACFEKYVTRCNIPQWERKDFATHDVPTEMIAAEHMRIGAEHDATKAAIATRKAREKAAYLEYYGKK